MVPFRVQWLYKRLLSSSFRQSLSSVLENPADFHRGVLSKAASNRKGEAVRLKLKSGRVAICRSFMSFYIFDEIFIQQVYDTGLAAPRTLIDIGANVGLFTLWARERWPGAFVLAIEPEPSNHADLDMMISENKLDRVEAIRAAVTDTGDPVTLYRHHANTGGHSIVERTGDAITVPGYTLGAALAALPEGVCDFLKVDCEGAENEILRGMTSDIARNISAIVYEPSPKLYSVTELNSRLEELGFQVRPHRDLVLAVRQKAA